MTSLERMYALYQAVRYVIEADIPGAVVECGVWRGGSCMLAALTMMQVGDLRQIWLYDTFEGMTEPSEHDVRWDGTVASQRYRELGGGQHWCFASLEEVVCNMGSTGYPADKLVFVKGPVEQTLMQRAPESIALLRLDTDWYESTWIELEVLFPRMSRGSVLIVDDYGWWAGARKAVREFLSRNQVAMLLNRIDETGRIGVKL